MDRDLMVEAVTRNLCQLRDAETDPAVTGRIETAIAAVHMIVEPEASATVRADGADTAPTA